jgi:hypothetical protein
MKGTVSNDLGSIVRNKWDFFHSATRDNTSRTAWVVGSDSRPQVSFRRSLPLVLSRRFDHIHTCRENVEVSYGKRKLPLSSTAYRLPADLLLRRLSRRRCLAWTTRAASLALPVRHLLELLLLVGVQDRFDLGGELLPNLRHLGPTVLLRQRSIFAQRLHLRGFVFKERLDLLLLSVAQVQLFAHAIQALVGRHWLARSAPRLSRALLLSLLHLRV